MWKFGLCQKKIHGKFYQIFGKNLPSSIFFPKCENLDLVRKKSCKFDHIFGKTSKCGEIQNKIKKFYI